jgi:hypothetical protein
MKRNNYIRRRLCLIESAAMAELTLAAHRVLLRLELELLYNAGKNNGALIVTYNNFVAFGIRRPSIAPAIRLLVKVGLVQITDRGWRAAEHGRPAKYRLTYLPAYGKPPTDEWEGLHPKPPPIRGKNSKSPCSSESVTTGKRNSDTKA